MEKDGAQKFIRRAMENVVWDHSMPDRRSGITCPHSEVMNNMYEALYGPPNKQHEGLMTIVSKHENFIGKAEGAISKLIWLGVLAGMSSLGTLVLVGFRAMTH